MKLPTHFAIGILLIVSLSFGCQAPVSTFGTAGQYLPTPEQLASGIVNKYYFHFKSEDGYEKSTDIRYYQYHQLDSQRLSLQIFNPAFELTNRFLLRFENGKMKVEDEIKFYRGETLQAQVTENTLADWENDSASYHSIIQYPYGISEEVWWQQTASRDSSLMDRPAKLITHQRKRQYQYPDQDDRDYQTTITDLYVQGFGLFSRAYVFDDGTGQLELIEQMPVETFEARSRKVPARVAYIDPNNTLDPFSNFAPCNDKGQIYDYYNGNPDGHYRPGKYGLWEIFREQIDLPLLAQESGYLTFRFVINCMGETGWFVTEETDLDFKIKTFPETTVSHLFEIVRNLDDWQPSKLQEEAVDVYAYLTLKLKDGQLIEILP